MVVMVAFVALVEDEDADAAESHSLLTSLSKNGFAVVVVFNSVSVSGRCMTTSSGIHATAPSTTIGGGSVEDGAFFGVLSSTRSLMNWAVGSIENSLNGNNAEYSWLITRLFLSVQCTLTSYCTVTLYVV